MPPGWSSRRERAAEMEAEGDDGEGDDGQRSGETSTAAARTDYHDDDDGAPESLDFQTIYNAAFELRRSSLDPGRRAAFESSSSAAENFDPDLGLGGLDLDAVSAAAGASVGVVAGISGGDTSAELKLRGKPFLGIKPHTLFKLAATAAIGLGTGCLAASLASAVDRGLRFRNATIHSIVRAHGFSAGGVAVAALFSAAWAALLTSLSALLVASLSPVAAGSGVSLVMAYLNGNAVPRLLEGRTLAVKWLGTGLSVASGVTLGLEAPLVHVGACVASLCADAAGRAWEVSYKVAERVGDWRWGKEVTSGSEEREQPSLLQRKGKSSRHRQRRRFIPILQSDAERREFVSAGVAAGLAAAFGAPIGGVLFAMEEASTHWSRKVGWRAFLAATASAVALNQLYPRAFGVLRFAGVAPLSALEWTQQLPLLALVAAVGGLMGAAFQAMHRSAARRARRSRESASDNSGGQKSKKGATTAAFVLRAAVTSAAIVLSMFALSLAAGTCVEVPEWRDKGYGFVLTCPAGTYNDLATLFFAPAADTASHIFSSGALTPRFNVCSKGGSGAPGTEEDSSCYFTLRSLALLCPSYFVAMAASSATGLPGGLFLPSIVAGGAFGGTAGLLLSRALPAMRLQAGLFAMVGATAALGGVFRASVALVVLVVEGTQSVRFLLAIAVAAIAANWAGDLCRPGGVYESDLEADGRVVFLRPTPPLALRSRTAGTVAARGVWALREVESVAYVLEVLTRTRHNGFPVVAEKRERKGKERKEGGEKESGEGGGVGGASSAAAAAAEEQQQQQQQPASSDPVSSATSREGVLVGLILRSQLLVLLRARCFCDGRGRAIPRAAAEAAVVAAAEASAAQEGGAGAAAAPPAAEENDDDHDHHHSHDVFALDSAMRSFFRLSGAPTRRAASLAPALSAAVSLRRRRSRSTTTTTTSAAAAPPPPPPPSLADCFVDLRPFMDRAPLSVRPECPAERAHAAFVSLGLRHLPLTTAEGRLCGMLTRKDLDAAAGAGPWRRSRIASAPAPPPPGGLHVPSELLPPGGASPGVEGLLGRRARDFAAAVWPGGGNYSSSGSLRNQGGRGGGGGEDRV